MAPLDQPKAVAQKRVTKDNEEEPKSGKVIDKKERKDAKEADGADDDENEQETEFGRKVLRKGVGIIIKYYNEKKFDDSESSSKKSTTQEVHFDNFEVEARSPQGQSPTGNSQQLAEAEWELSLPQHATGSENSTSQFFILVTTLNISMWFHIPFIMMRYGGVYFAIPFMLCSIFVTTPIAFLEIAFGQYTSLPHIVLFERMAPILSGVGYVILVIQLCSNATFKFEHKFMSIIVETVMRMLADERATFCDFADYGTQTCYVPGKCKDLVFYRGMCIDPAEIAKDTSVPYETKLLFLTRSFLQSDPQLKDVLVPKINPHRILNPYFPQAHNINAAILSFFIAFFFARRGLTYISEVAWLIFAATASLVVVLTVDVIWNWSDVCMMLLSVIGYSWENFVRLFELETWFVALITSFTCFSVANGTMLTIGATRKFHNGIYRDVLVQLIGGFFFYILTSYIAGVVVLSGTAMGHAQLEARSLTPEDARSKLNDYRNAFYGIYLFYSSDTFHIIFFFLFSLVLIAWQACNQAVTAEVVILLAYRFVRNFINLPEEVVRVVVLLVFLSGTILIHVLIDVSKYSMIVFSLLFVAAFEVLAVNVYSTRKLLPNLYSMLDDKWRESTRKLRVGFFFVYQIFLPIVLVGAVFYQSMHPQKYYYFAAPVLVLGFGVRQVAKRCNLGSLQTSFASLWKPQPTWGPHNIKDRITANFYERAIRLDA